MTAIFIVAIALILICLGMMFVPKNDWYGIRCPWSMYSKGVWENVHKFAGYTCAMCLCNAAVNIFTGDIGIDTLVFALIAPLVFAIAYAYFVHRKKTRGLRKIGAIALATSNAALLVWTAIFIILSALCLSEQIDSLQPFAGGKIATHFNAQNKADGWTDSSAFLEYFQNIQALGAGMGALCAFGSIFFTKNTFAKDGKFASKIIVATFSLAACTCAIAMYYTGVILSVASANAATPKNASIDFFAMPHLAYFAAFAIICGLLYPAIMGFRALCVLRLDPDCKPYKN